MNTALKTYDEIKDTITNRLGITDQLTYKTWVDQFHARTNPRIPTPEDIDLLSPDTVDNRDFWRVIKDLFETDPVSNCQHGRSYSVEEANRNNMGIYHLDGFTGMIHNVAGRASNILEIGPGYGAFRDYLRRFPELTWHGADVFPLIGGVDQNESTGLLSELTKSRYYLFVASSNVFQHLSVAQRRAYYSDVFQMLLPSGVFMVNQAVHWYADNHPATDVSGRQWMKHYGQFTEIQKPSAIFADVKKAGFDIVSQTLRGGSWLTLTLQKPAVSPSLILSPDGELIGA